MKLLGRSWYVPFYEPLSCISLCWREQCRFCPLPELDALPSSSPDRSHNGKTPPAVSLLLWDTERSGLKGVIQVTDSNRGLLLELFICAPSQFFLFFLIITHLFRTSFSILYHFSTHYDSLSINIRHRCTWYFGQVVGDEDRKLVLSSCGDIQRGG